MDTEGERITSNGGFYFFQFHPNIWGRWANLTCNWDIAVASTLSAPTRIKEQLGVPPNSVAMVFIVFSSDSSGVFPLFIGVHPTIPSINKPAHQTLESDQDGTTPTAQRIAALCEFHGVCIFRRFFFWLVLSNIVMFTPTSGNDPIWRPYFSTGLVQPPTSCLFHADFSTSVLQNPNTTHPEHISAR